MADGFASHISVHASDECRKVVEGHLLAALTAWRDEAMVDVGLAFIADADLRLAAIAAVDHIERSQLGPLCHVV